MQSLFSKGEGKRLVQKVWAGDQTKNVEPGASWILIPWEPVTHWVTLGKSLDLLLYPSHPHWKLGERHDLTEKHMLHWSWAFLRKQITMPAAFFSVLCHFACVLWWNSVQELYFDVLFSSSTRDLCMSINKVVGFFSRKATTICVLAKARFYFLYIGDTFCFLYSYPWDTSGK